MNFQNKIIDVVFTNFNNSKVLKEQKLKNIFNYENITYSRNKVKEIVYTDYKSKGGYKSFDEITNWIFE